MENNSVVYEVCQWTVLCHLKKNGPWISGNV